MIDRFAQLPASLAAKARWERLGPTGVPALLAHPDWKTPAPVVIWMHGRTVNKELDSGRYIRWLKAGIAVCSIDLPGHGERFEEHLHSPSHTLDVLDAVIPEIDHVVETLADPRWGGWGGAFDLDRMAVGGMSAGGMAALRRLCDAHPFLCAAVEATSGNLAGMYQRTDRPWPVQHPAERVARLDPMQHLEGWRPIPLLALHSESDRVVPVVVQRVFVEALKKHYVDKGANPGLIEFRTWPDTGAPQEHAGFGRFGNDAKNIQTEFLTRWLAPR